MPVNVCNPYVLQCHDIPGTARKRRKRKDADPPDDRIQRENRLAIPDWVYLAIGIGVPSAAAIALWARQMSLPAVRGRQALPGLKPARALPPGVRAPDYVRPRPKKRVRPYARFSTSLGFWLDKDYRSGP